jgi:hypothetical protein
VNGGAVCGVRREMSHGGRVEKAELVLSLWGIGAQISSFCSEADPFAVCFASLLWPVCLPASHVALCAGTQPGERPARSPLLVSIPLFLYPLASWNVYQAVCGSYLVCASACSVVLREGARASHAATPRTPICSGLCSTADNVLFFLVFS